MNNNEIEKFVENEESNVIANCFLYNYWINKLLTKIYSNLPDSRAIIELNLKEQNLHDIIDNIKNTLVEYGEYFVRNSEKFKFFTLVVSSEKIIPLVYVVTFNLKVHFEEDKGVEIPVYIYRKNKDILLLWGDIDRPVEVLFNTYTNIINENK
ncbi:MAG: hypothetical protein ACOCUV_02415 [bacterium]